MFCIKCWNKLRASDKFCTKCAFPTWEYHIVNDTSTLTIEQKWWFRLSKVIYIVLYIPLIFAAWIAWDGSAPSSYYSSYSQEYTYYWSYAEAFWYTFLTILIWIATLRLIKLWFLYIAFWMKPNWYREFRKLF